MQLVHGSSQISVQHLQRTLAVAPQCPSACIDVCYLLSSTFPSYETVMVRNRLMHRLAVLGMKVTVLFVDIAE